MDMFEGGDDAQQEPGDQQHLLQCPHCHKRFTQKKGLLKHINFHCKFKVLPASQDILPSPRRVTTPPVKLRHDKELDGLLATISSPYVRWRLAKEMCVVQQTAYPILFNYRFPGSKSSELSSLCPTSDPYLALYKILRDGKMNYQVEEISVSKDLVIVTASGKEINVSQHLKPLNDREERSNRPKVKVEENETHLLFSITVEDVT